MGLGLDLHGSGEKAKPRQKQLAHRCRFTLTLKTVFRFFLAASVGIPKSFRGFRLFPRQGRMSSTSVSTRHENMMRVLLGEGYCVQLVHVKARYYLHWIFHPRLTIKKHIRPKLNVGRGNRRNKRQGFRTPPSRRRKRKTAFKRQREHTSSNTLLLPRFSFFTAGGQSRLLRKRPGALRRFLLFPPFAAAPTHSCTSISVPDQPPQTSSRNFLPRLTVHECGCQSVYP